MKYTLGGTIGHSYNVNFNALDRKMVRDYVRKTPKRSEENIQNAIAAVKDGASIRSVSKQFKVPFETLRARVKGNCSSSIQAHQICRVFNDKQEKMLRDYLVKAANIFYVLSYQQIRLLAFQYACKLKEIGDINKVPASWIAENLDGKPAASRDWLHGFMKRQPDLSLRRPMQTSSE